MAGDLRVDNWGHGKIGEMQQANKFPRFLFYFFDFGHISFVLYRY